ncbi:DNA-formamidopyrimidine glycosylase [Thermodesulfobacterium sp. TA1]|uniref:DNA-formamidopyrimidine glycosylase n=1 Tax=Thermodesulfobacterium sp. TA1 TaxID=2234087 RepID=UPI0012319F07|nr:DNA-formamidopyrimidine glycosylase [Thermodesulfobacterium sp. TA1]QER41573.1 DNA-formamidopyrimidine glycosylase [Thermodesulfobacterium sp. TA1]
MPELPEVETIKQQLKKALTNQKLVEVKVLDPDFVKKISLEDLFSLKGEKLLDIKRKGKYLWFVFEKKNLLWHLGLTGGLILLNRCKTQINPKFLRLSLNFEKDTLGYFDIRKFGRIKVFDPKHLPKEISTLGKDALEIDQENFGFLLKNSSKPVKTLLLDQTKISGLGNIYVDEALFRAGIHPLKKASSLNKEELNRLYHTIKALLHRAIELRGSSVKDYIDAQGQKGRFQEEHLVYGKKGQICPICGETLQYIKVNQRGTTFCKNCQS